MIAKRIENLVFAGRNISVTHAALSSSRVMATCAILGQALGTAVAQAIHTGVHVADVDIPHLQQTLMADDCYIPYHQKALPALTLAAKTNAEIVRDGVERGDEHLWRGKVGEAITYTFDADTLVSKVRIVFDSDFNRNYDNMPSNYPLVQPRFHLPKTLVTAYRIIGENEQGETFTLEIAENHQRLRRHQLGWQVKSISLIPLSANGDEQARVFSFEVK